MVCGVCRQDGGSPLLVECKPIQPQLSEFRNLTAVVSPLSEWYDIFLFRDRVVNMCSLACGLFLGAESTAVVGRELCLLSASPAAAAAAAGGCEKKASGVGFVPTSIAPQACAHHELLRDTRWLCSCTPLRGRYGAHRSATTLCVDHGLHVVCTGVGVAGSFWADQGQHARYP